MRPKGSVNKRSNKLFEELADKVAKMTDGAVTDYDPIVYLATFAAGYDPSTSEKFENKELRVQASIAVSPYLYAKLKSVEYTGDLEDGPLKVIVKNYVQQPSGKIVELHPEAKKSA
jgi:hypothetical protein